MIDKMIADLRRWADTYRRWAAEDRNAANQENLDYLRGMKRGEAIVGEQAAADLDRIADRWEIRAKYEAWAQKFSDMLKEDPDVTGQEGSTDES